MPYIIEERRPTGGRLMYLIKRPSMSNSLGEWTLEITEAETFPTHMSATTACEMLALCNAGTVLFVSDIKIKIEEKKVGLIDMTKWVVQSNVTGDYLASVAEARRTELWVEFVRNAMLFDTVDEARKLTSEYLIGISNNPAALDIDYIQIDSISYRTINENVTELIRVPDKKNPRKEPEYVIRCLRTNMYFEMHAAMGKAERWTLGTNKAQKYVNTAAAASAILRMAHTPRVEIIETINAPIHKAIPVESDINKKNFKIKMRHGVGFSVERTYVGITEVEAVKKMFEAVADAHKSRFDIGTMEEVGKVSTASKVKIGAFESQKSM